MQIIDMMYNVMDNRDARMLAPIFVAGIPPEDAPDILRAMSGRQAELLFAIAALDDEGLAHVYMTLGHMAEHDGTTMVHEILYLRKDTIWYVIAMFGVPFAYADGSDDHSVSPEFLQRILPSLAEMYPADIARCVACLEQRDTRNAEQEKILGWMKNPKTMRMHERDDKDDGGATAPPQQVCRNGEREDGLFRGLYDTLAAVNAVYHVSIRSIEGLREFLDAHPYTPKRQKSNALYVIIEDAFGREGLSVVMHDIQKIAGIVTHDTTAHMTRGMKKVLQRLQAVMSSERFRSLVQQIALHEKLEIEGRTHEEALAEAGLLQQQLCSVMDELDRLQNLDLEARDTRHFDREHARQMWQDIETVQRVFSQLAGKQVSKNDVFALFPHLKSVYTHILADGRYAKGQREVVVSLTDVQRVNNRDIYAYLELIGVAAQGKLVDNVRVILIHDCANYASTEKQEIAAMNRAQRQLMRLAHSAPAGSEIEWVLSTQALHAVNAYSPQGNAVRVLIAHGIAKVATVRFDGKLEVSGYIGNDALDDIQRMKSALHARDVADVLNITLEFRAMMIDKLAGQHTWKTSDEWEHVVRIQAAEMQSSLKLSEETIACLWTMGWMIFDDTRGIVAHTDISTQEYARVMTRVPHAVYGCTVSLPDDVVQVNSNGTIRIPEQHIIENGAVLEEIVERNSTTGQETHKDVMVLEAAVMDLDGVNRTDVIIARVAGLMCMMVGTTMAVLLQVVLIIEYMYSIRISNEVKMQQYKVLAAAA